MSDETLAQKLTGRKDGTPEQAQEMVNALAEAASLAESQNQALQERAEKAEARLQLAEDALAMYQAGAVTHISIESRPTQETDPE